MHARTEWTTAHAPGGTFSTPRKGVPDIFIHHEGGGARGVPADKPAVLRQIESYVVNNLDYIAIDYNVMVFNDGQVWAGREVFNEDAATYQNNDTSVSICAVGNYEIESAPDALVSGIQQAIREIVASGYSNGSPSIRPHRDVYSTACPGRNLVARLDEIRNWESGGIAEAPPAPKGVDQVYFIQVPGGAAIATSDGLHKNVFANPDEFATAQWCAAVAGCPNVNVILVSQGYWDSLKTV